MPVRAEAVCGGQEGETQRQEKKPRDPQREEWGTKPGLGCAAHLVSARSTGPATPRRSSAGTEVCEYRAVTLGSPRTSTHVVRLTRASCADISDASSSSSQFAVQPIEPSCRGWPLDERQPFNKCTGLDGLVSRRSLVSARRTVDGPSSLVFTSPRHRKDVRRSAHTRGRRVEAAGSPRLAAVCSNSWREAVK